MIKIYRQDIDGLRAIAILSVLFFHLGFEAFNGGFLGVDVFFVISGYLITQQIKIQVEAGNFSFSHFYLRRARRLFPALFFTIFISFLIAILLFDPAHLERFGGALTHVLASISNIFFWAEADYFDAEAKMKPLLHTWSLSVEGQFYLIWPMTLVFLLKHNRKGLAPAFLILLCIGSLLLNQAFQDGQFFLIDKLQNIAPAELSLKELFANGRSTIFYLLPFRLFEFGLGAIVLWLDRLQPRNPLLLEPILLLGIVLVAYPVFGFTENALIPWLYALLSCLGAAMVIYAGRAPILGRILSNPVASSIGVISYSLYLIHWPMIVFWDYYNVDPTGLMAKWTILFLSISAAWLMYRHIETPFRRSKARQLEYGDTAFTAAIFALSTVLFLLGGNIWKNEGWKWRVDKNFAYSEKEYHAKFYGGAGYPINRFFLMGKEKPKKDFIMVGDSYGLQYARSLDIISKKMELNVEGLFHHNCFIAPDYTTFINGAEEPRCASEYNKLKQKMQENPDQDLIMAFAWFAYKPKTVARGAGKAYFFYNDDQYNRLVQGQVREIISQGGGMRNYYIIGNPNPSFNSITCLGSSVILKRNCKTTIERNNLKINEYLQSLQNGKNVFFIDPNEALCYQGKCLAILEGNPVYSDGKHLSIYGADKVVRYILGQIVKLKHL